MDDPQVDRRRSTEYVTIGEFARTLTLLEEIRSDLKAGQEVLRVELVAVGKRITDRQDVSNGRLLKVEGELVANIVDLKVLEARAAEYRETRIVERAEEQATVVAIKDEVETLMAEGCRVRKQHVSEMDALNQAGVFAPGSKWRKAGPTALAGLGGLGLGALAPHLVTAVHWILDHLVAK